MRDSIILIRIRFAEFNLGLIKTSDSRVLNIKEYVDKIMNEIRGNEWQYSDIMQKLHKYFDFEEISYSELEV